TTAPPAAAQQGGIHLVLKPQVPQLPGWTPERAAKRLLDLLERQQAEFRANAGEGNEPRRARPELTPTRDAVVVWSLDRQPTHSLEWTPRQLEGIESVERDLRLDQRGLPTLAPRPYLGARIHANDVVKVAEVRIATPLLYDQWQVNVETVTRAYGRDQADSSNADCQFTLRMPGRVNALMERAARANGG